MSENRYPFWEVEPKIQKFWRENHVNDIDLDDPAEKKQYVLVMFSYPSASKLHIGHWWNYGPTDTYSRFKRMQGYKVFEPMGFDSFGLPAENFAIKVGTHPKQVTEQSISSIQAQLEAIGAMYDWRYRVITSHADYYKWTQWLFLKLFEHDLAYENEGMVNWCPSCQTVLANEQVVSDGHCERCGAEVSHKKMKQWYFRITKYADELLLGLNEIDWPESTKTLQRNWIGRSEGAWIKFPLDGIEGEIEVFTTRPDTIYGVTYVVVAPESSLVEKVTSRDRLEKVKDYVNSALHATEVERTAKNRAKTGVFTGGYVTHPLTGAKLPIWVADYVLGSYGTGAVMAVPAHDQRDFEFAQEHSLPMQIVIRPTDQFLEIEEMREAYEEEGIMQNSENFSGVPSVDGKNAVTEKLEKLNAGAKAVTYRLRDWSISRQRYWGAPIPVVHCEDCGVVAVKEEDLPVLLPEEIEDFRPKGTSPLGGIREWMETTCPKCGKPAERDPNTMDTFVDSSFYHLRYLAADNHSQPFRPDRMKEWLPIDTYVGGSDHSTGHLIYFRFITRFLHEIGISPVAEPARRMIHQGLIKKGGIKMSKSKENVVNPDLFVKRHGADVFRIYLMFMGDYRIGGDWSDEGISGIDRFINRVWRLVRDFRPKGKVDGTPIAKDYPESVYRAYHFMVKAVAENLEAFSFNTAISRMMELVNELYGWLDTDAEIVDHAAIQRILKNLIIVLAPFAPHFSEECWQRMNEEGSIFDQTWPEFDPEALVQDTIELVIQVNGKVRDRLEAPADTDKKRLEEMALESDRVKEFLKTGTLRKVIVVPGKLVNLVIN